MCGETDVCFLDMNPFYCSFFVLFFLIVEMLAAIDTNPAIIATNNAMLDNVNIPITIAAILMVAEVCEVVVDAVLNIVSKKGFIIKRVFYYILSSI